MPSKPLPHKPRDVLERRSRATSAPAKRRQNNKDTNSTIIDDNSIGPSTLSGNFNNFINDESQHGGKFNIQNADSSFGIQPGISFVSESSNAMLEAKYGRQKAENDLQVLASRIGLLRAEEQKALVKVAETKTRAKEILGQKKRHEDAIQLKLAQNMERELKVKAAQEKATMEREYQQKKLQLSQRINKTAKQTLAQSLKEDAIKNTQLLTDMHNEMELQRKMKILDEKKRREQSRIKKEKDKIEKERKLHEEYSKRISNETAKRLDAEEAMDSLEKEEKALIERLKVAQTLQQKAYFVLQKSLEA
jgi:hypothetical protein